MTLGRFVVRRGLQAVATLLLASLVVHLAVTVLPGDPARALFGFRPPPPEVIAKIRARYHLDEPYVVQYWLYVRDVVTFDLGTSLRTGRSVNEMVSQAWPATVRLVSVAMVLQVVVGIVGGLITSIHPRTWASRGILAGSVLMIAVPVVLSTYVLQGLFSLRLPLFPIGGTHEGLRSYVLPGVALAAMTTGAVVIFLRSELRQTLRAPFIRFATSSGVARARVVGVHALRPALPPIVAYLAANLGQIVLGVMIVEGVFNLRGLGGVMFGAIRAQDRSVVVSLVMLITVLIVVINTAADIVVAMLDPRARVGLEGEVRS